MIPSDRHPRRLIAILALGGVGTCVSQCHQDKRQLRLCILKGFPILNKSTYRRQTKTIKAFMRRPLIRINNGAPTC